MTGKALNDGKRLIHAEQLVRKNPPFHGQVIDSEPLVREIPLFTDKLMILGQPLPEELLRSFRWRG